ncbi:bifunctional heptose 7-phosphate kinase/heptose 1-phosphate adenyltransferase [Mucilaginibacter sp.]|uniref:bifunctional heptose 7-phosphate kinase/heptose 1-phosphate adenyltransferase n=1 Tax=Mucilaginibacter sp. TaxID=1882438 RepID=UPI0026175236|nr:PfkB family carbohydrate kinase [Mucilaginibacter sp.]MDB4926317.1 D-glycero-beta-D-manno-heptose-7-phosphate kinase [Mucilaginibacter sp.]
MPVYKFPDHKKAKICVIGDIMLDHYINGSCDRISPEAPVQIIDVTDEVYSLGGAGNVLKNLQAFGCEGSLISISGNDDTSQIVVEELQKITPSFYHLAKDSNRRTTIKSRVVVNRHQLIRLDKEDKVYCTEAIADDIFEFLKTKITELDVVILSDYCKGVLSTRLVKNIIKLCAGNKVITIVDSKDKDLSKYYKATLIKPNKKEASLASGISIINDDTLEQACKKIADVTACQTVIVTLSEDGIAIYDQNKLTKKPTKALDVFDVTGAGDTVVAALAFALANKLSISEACDLANSAAAIVVAKFGSAVATIEEINNLNSK